MSSRSSPADREARERARTVPPRGFVVVAALLAFASLVSAEERAVEDEAAGLAAALPGADWTLRDLSSSGVVCHVYAPDAGMVPRATLMRWPRAYLPEDLRSRAAQVERAPGVTRLRLEAGETAGIAGLVYEYADHGRRTVERGFAVGDVYFIVQVSADDADWAKPERKAGYDRFLSSIRVLRAREGLPALRMDPKTPDEVRRARAATRPADLPYAIRDHDVSLSVWPAERRLEVTDRMVVEATAPLISLDLVTSHVEVVAVRDGSDSLPLVRHEGGGVSARLTRPLAKGERRTLVYEARSAPFEFRHDQRLIAEMSMLGQVDPESSFSSHVLWYPIDRENDAPVRLSVTVPRGTVAVSGGDALPVEETPSGRTYRFVFPTPCPRLLPLGFAVAKYAEARGKSPTGLEVVVHALPGKEKEAHQRLAVALSCADLFERRMGPLPWRRVAICEVKPKSKETGVSLPGLILVSEGFFGDLEGVEFGGDLDDPRAHGLLLVADEMSHQWNAYATPLPNEFAEGVSTFTDLWTVEARRGADEYRRGLRILNRIYLAASEAETDVAVADPAIYASDLYRPVAFGKVAVVLGLLRRTLGDDVFFAAWRDAFLALRGRRVDLDDFERALSAAAKTDLSRFFRQWFFQAGHPVLRVTWTTRTSRSDTTLSVAVEQVQPGETYALDLPVEVSFEGSTPRRTLTVPLKDRRADVSFTVPSTPRSLVVDPDGLLPIHAAVTGP